MKEVEEFKRLIDEKSFYKAHEVLEELWFPIRHTKDDYCLILKGFINGAVAMELDKREKQLQCKKVHQTYLKYVSLEKIQRTEYQEIFKELRSFMDKRFEDIFKKRRITS